MNFTGFSWSQILLTRTGILSDELKLHVDVMVDGVPVNPVFYFVLVLTQPAKPHV